MNVFVRMLREIYKIEDVIVEAPPRLSLKAFGGPFDIEDFRTVKNVCTVVSPPFVSYCMLVEERQPIGSIGETSSSRGTVKGLRKPQTGSVPLIEDELCVPPAESTYGIFLKENAIEISEEVTSSVAKKQRVCKEKKNENGLARFMTKK